MENEKEDKEIEDDDEYAQDGDDNPPLHYNGWKKFQLNVVKNTLLIVITIKRKNGCLKERCPSKYSYEKTFLRVPFTCALIR